MLTLHKQDLRSTIKGISYPVVLETAHRAHRYAVQGRFRRVLLDTLPGIYHVPLDTVLGICLVLLDVVLGIFHVLLNTLPDIYHDLSETAPDIHHVLLDTRFPGIPRRVHHDMKEGIPHMDLYARHGVPQSDHQKMVVDILQLQQPILKPGNSNLASC